MPSPRFDLPASELNRLGATLREWAGFTGKGLEEAIREESRPLTRDLINYTPPRIRGSSNDFQTIAPLAQRRAAEQQIERDVRRTFKPLQDVVSAFQKVAANSRSSKVNYPRVISYLKQYVSEGRMRAIETILRDFHYKAIVARRAGPEMYEIFRAQKTATRVLVLDASSIDEAVKEIVKAKKKRLGFGKSGWNKSARGLGLGAKVPRWVSEKSGRGDFKPEGRGLKFSLTLENRVRHVQRNPDQITGKALRRRARSLENRMNAMLEKGVKRARARR